MNYDKYFDTSGKPPAKTVPAPKSDARSFRDRRDGQVYVYNQRIELAVNVALATGRPILVRGPSGSGKSSLARHVSTRLNWRYYEQVITSRTQARDLQWSFDSLRRLGDAQAGTLDPDPAHYVQPGALWWAFDPASAARRGRPLKDADGKAVEVADAAPDPGRGAKDATGAVVLLDEIDKADPDVPNNLLVPLGSFELTVGETGAGVSATRPLLVFITTNDERVLPTAFMRRCVVLELEPPDEDLLVSIARAHFGKDEKGIYRTVAKRVVEIAAEAAAGGASGSAAGQRPAPSTAEYLDTIRACLELGINPVETDDGWQALMQATLAKRQGAA